jgi:hypothetical protein
MFCKEILLLANRLGFKSKAEKAYGGGPKCQKIKKSKGGESMTREKES